MNTTTTRDFAPALSAFVALAQAKIDAGFAGLASYHPTLSIDPRGRRYARIVRTDGNKGSRSVHCFVDRTNGNVLKAAGWKGPAKHARGNIFNADGGSSGVSQYGGTYLR